MLDFLKNEPMNVVIVEDMYVSADTMEAAIRASQVNVGKVSRIFWGATTKDEWAVRQLNLERNGSEAEPYAEGVEGLLADCDVLCVHFSPVARKMIEAAPQLKAIMTCRGGLEHINVAAATERNIPVINCIRNAIPVAEFTIGLMLNITREMAYMHHDMIRGIWNKEFPNDGNIYTLMNQTVGLVGMGNIGIEIAIRLKAFGTKMLVWDPYLDMGRIKANGIEDAITVCDSAEEVFEKADIVSLHMRLVPATQGMIDKKFFDLMKPTAFFINSARGGLINQDDLLDALKNRRIAGAALDVFDKEPGGAEFAGMDNVVLTPHMAGTTEEAVPKSPLMLFKEVDNILTKGLTDRIVNYKNITL